MIDDNSYRRMNWRDYQYADEDWYEARPPVDLRAALAPLLEVLTAYDRLRGKLELEGGELAELRQLTALLNQEVLIAGRYHQHRLPLTQQAALRQALRDIDDDLRLDIRQLPSRLPVYYLCRTRSDYWSAYSLVVEDLYLSPGYPLADERFARLMRGGKEEYFLRLSPFRQAAAPLAEAAGDRATVTVDGLLYTVGRQVFQAAWHEDQRLAVITARHFQLPRLRSAIELLYLVLSGELCELRHAVDDTLLSFFKVVYRQSVIRRLLTHLTLLEGGLLNELPQRARTAYPRLLQAFSHFLATEVPWGKGQSGIPLWRLIYGNLNRLELIAGELRGNKALARAAAALEATAQALVDELLNLPVAGTDPRDGPLFPEPEESGQPPGRQPGRNKSPRRGFPGKTPGNSRPA